MRARQLLPPALGAVLLLAALAVAQPASSPDSPEKRIERLEENVDLLGKRLLASRLEVDALKSKAGAVEAKSVLQQREIDRLDERLRELEADRGGRRR
jgi:hypothetical protein